MNDVKANLALPVLAIALVVPGVFPAMASAVYIIPPEAPPYLINPSAAGVDTLEAFIQTPGVSFASPGFVNLDPGWNEFDINPTYSLEYGPASTMLTEDLNVSGGGSFVVDFYAFTGCASLQPISACPVQDLTDQYQVTVNGGNYVGWTPLPPNNLFTEDTTPEPATMLVIGLGLIGLVVRRCRQR